MDLNLTKRGELKTSTMNLPLYTGVGNKEERGQKAAGYSNSFQ